MKSIDFEFFNSNEPHPTLVCAAMDGRKYWLLNGEDSSLLIRDIKSHSQKFLAYYAIAEARCFIALGLNPLDFEWIDLYAEFKMQQNCNDKYQYGHYIDKDGSQKFSEPPVIGEDEDEKNKRKVPSNLVNAVYKNTGYIISSKEKEEVRDIILSKNTQLIEQNKKRIMDYCLEDTLSLQKLYDGITSCYIYAGLRNFEKDILSRGAYAAATARSEQLGIPINIELLNKVIEKTPLILEEIQEETNKVMLEKIGRKLFLPEYRPPAKTFKNGKIHEYKIQSARKDTKAYQVLIDSLNISDFPKTDSGLYKSDKQTLELYPYIPALDKIWHYNKTESSLKWFNKENGDGFFEAYGSDNKVRPFYGIFGTQTGRNAAKAKTFPLAMSSWLRAIIQPSSGWFIVAADFSQQEVAVAAWISQDKNLIDAYNSGDVYLEFAKQAGLIPHTATKKTHKKERDLCKATVLGLQYGMGKHKLQHKLSYDSGAPVSMDKTMELITAHKTVFSQFWQWVYDLSHQYDRGYPLITSDGWVLWQDNPIKTSIRNAPVQGTSASITRQAFVDAWKEEMQVMCQLHDALYVLTQDPELTKAQLSKIMRKATQKILGENCIDIRIDMKVISHDTIWVEEKGQEEWEKINKHLLYTA